MQSLHVCRVVSSEILNEQTKMHMINSTRLLQNNIFHYYVYNKIEKRITYSSQLTGSIHWHCYGTAHVYIVIHFCDRIRSVRVEENKWRVFIVCLYLYCHWITNIKRGRVGIQWIGLIPPQCVRVLIQNLDVQRHMSPSFIVFYDFSWKLWLFGLLILVELLTTTVWKKNIDV